MESIKKKFEFAEGSRIYFILFVHMILHICMYETKDQLLNIHQATRGDLYGLCGDLSQENKLYSQATQEYHYHRIGISGARKKHEVESKQGKIKS